MSILGSRRYTTNGGELMGTIGMLEAGRRMGVSARTARRALRDAGVELERIHRNALVVDEKVFDRFLRARTEAEYTNRPGRPKHRVTYLAWVENEPEDGPVAVTLNYDEEVDAALLKNAPPEVIGAFQSSIAAIRQWKRSIGMDVVVVQMPMKSGDRTLPFCLVIAGVEKTCEDGDEVTVRVPGQVTVDVTYRSASI
jgi:hypothetical protein